RKESRIVRGAKATVRKQTRPSSRCDERSIRRCLNAPRHLHSGNSSVDGPDAEGAARPLVPTWSSRGTVRLVRGLVIGPTGFSGRVVVRELVPTGVSIRALVRGPSPEARLARMTNGAPVECAPGDMVDGAAVRRAVVDCNAVVHLAARV